MSVHNNRKRLADEIQVCNTIGMDSLPNEILELILSKLPENDLASASEVNTIWNRTVKQIPPKGLNVFGKEAWENFFGFIFEGEIPPPPKNIFQTTRSFRRSLGKTNEALSFTALLIPKGLNVIKIEKNNEQ